VKDDRTQLTVTAVHTVYALFYFNKNIAMKLVRVNTYGPALCQTTLNVAEPNCRELSRTSHVSVIKYRPTAASEPRGRHCENIDECAVSWAISSRCRTNRVLGLRQLDEAAAAAAASHPRGKRSTTWSHQIPYVRSVTLRLPRSPTRIHECSLTASLHSH